MLVERGRGEVRIVPVAWTDLEPSRPSLTVDGRAICLGPREALALANRLAKRIRRDAEGA